MITPYYKDDKCTIYHGDCREILPTIGTFDLLLTDPPYGISADSKMKAQAGKKGKLAYKRDYGDTNWDSAPVDDWVMLLARQITKHQIIFGGNYYALPASSCWLVWDKQVNGNFADCELAWTNLKQAVRMKTHMWNGMLRKGQEQRFHPTQKPLEVMSWALAQAGEVETVLDPWMGSGTTLRACKDVGVHCVGIEREEKYCEIAVQRLAQECLALD